MYAHTDSSINYKAKGMEIVLDRAELVDGNSISSSRGTSQAALT